MERGLVVNIEKETLSNDDFRRVIFTAPNSQIVLMSIAPEDEIGKETHQNADQFLRVESGHGKVVLNDHEYDVGDGFAIVVPAGTEHNILNTSESEPLKLYTIYSPPQHEDGTVHHTRDEAMQAEE